MTLAEDVKRIRAALWGKAPFISSLLGRARIVETKGISTAGVDRRTWIYVNPEYWAELDLLSKVWLIAHETNHAAFLHPPREGSRVPNPETQPEKHLIWNTACDSVVNAMLEELIRAPEMERFAVTADRIAELTGESEDNVRKMCVEEIYDLLEKTAAKVKIEIDLIPGNGPRGKAVQKGSRRSANPPRR